MECVQIEDVAVQHADITLKQGSQTFNAVKTVWPLGIAYMDAGATAFDEVDGYVPVSSAVFYRHRCR
jgi:hypothetical protein